MDVELRHKIITAVKNRKLYTHLSPDVDALCSLYTIYRYVKPIHTDKDSDAAFTKQFIESINYIPHSNTIEDGGFGVDLGNNISHNSIKSGTVHLNRRIIKNACSSMYLGYHLLSKCEFDAAFPLLNEINRMDTDGYSAYQNRQNAEEATSRAAIYMTSLWGIIGSISSSMKSRTEQLTLIFAIFDNLINEAIARYIDNAEASEIKPTRYPAGRYCLHVTPLNAGRRPVNRSLSRTDRYPFNLAIFKTFDDTTKTGTFGVTVSNEFSRLHNIRDITEDTRFKQAFNDMGDMLISEYAIGMTDKNPLENTTADTIEGYANKLMQIVFAFLQRISLKEDIEHENSTM